VHEAAAVDLLEAARDLERHEPRDARRERADLGERAGQVGAVHVLLGDVEPAAPAEAVVDPHHVRVVHGGHRGRLAREALLLARIGVELTVQRLQHHAPAEGGLPRQVDHAHPAARELGLDLVAGDLAPGRLGHGGPAYSSRSSQVRGGASRFSTTSWSTWRPSSMRSP